MEKRKKNIVLFASGNGTNVENIIRYFQDRKTVGILEVLTNNPHAAVVDKANKMHVPVRAFSRQEFSSAEGVVLHLKKLEPDLIILAGFLWKIPVLLIQQFPQKIINIHPALLPDFGGKGMYGMHVHEAVIASGAKQSGITVHFVEENYDEGRIIFQATTEVSDSDTPESLAGKIHQLEYMHYPKVIEQFLTKAKRQDYPP